MFAIGVACAKTIWIVLVVREVFCASLDRMWRLGYLSSHEHDVGGMVSWLLLGRVFF